MLNTYTSTCDNSGSIIGLAVADCDLKSLGMFLGTSALSKEVRFVKDMTEQEFRTSWENYIRDGKIIPLGQAYGFTPNIPENRTATSSLDIKSNLGYGIPDFVVEYDRSHCFDNQLAKLYDKTWDYVFHFEKGMLITTTSDGNYLKGYDCSYNSKAFNFQTNNSAQISKAMFQFSYTGAIEINERKVVLDVNKIGFNPLESTGVIQLKLNVVSAEAGNDNIIELSVVNACNGNPITGLANAQFWGVNTDTQNTIDGSPADMGNGVYKIPMNNNILTGEKYTFYLTDGTYNSIITQSGTIYSGSVTAIVE